MYGLERRRAVERIHELIDTFEMGDYIDELCENYSQGMKQRVVFALHGTSGPLRWRDLDQSAPPPEGATPDAPVEFGVDLKPAN